MLTRTRGLKGLLSRSHCAALCVAVASFAGASSLSAQAINIGGNVSDANIGPLQSGEVYHVNSDLTIPQGETLTVEPGVIIKMGIGRGWRISGAVDFQGQADEPVVVTSILDDTFGGDTNGDGPSVGQARDWNCMRFEFVSQGARMEHTLVQYGGREPLNFVFSAMIELIGANHTLEDVTVRHGGSDGVAITQSNGGHVLRRVTVEDCTRGLDMNENLGVNIIEDCAFLNNAESAIDEVALRGVDGFTNNQAQGNGNDWMLITSALLDRDLNIAPENTIDGVLCFDDGAQVNDGFTLTLQAGVTFKMDGPIDVNGSLVTLGTAVDKVNFTSFFDDSLGGDDNGDGPSVGAPGDWQDLIFSSSENSQLLHTTFRFAGRFSNEAVWLNKSDVVFDHVEFSDNDGNGLTLDAQGSNPSLGVVLRDCSFTNNAGHAVFGADLRGVGGFSNNQAQGNAQGNWVYVVAGDIDQDTIISADNGINGVFGVSDSISAPLGASLTVGPGVVFKMEASSGFANGISVGGSLQFLGTADEPVVVTSSKDDAVGGDSNGDGALSVPAPGDWRRLTAVIVTQQCRLEHVVFRYAGSGTTEALQSDSDQLELFQVRAEHGQDGGFLLREFASVERIVAWNNAGIGVSLQRENPDIAHITSVGNGVGIQRSTTYSGDVLNSIAWDNGTNYNGFAAGRLSYSNGSADLVGQDGNIDLDPLFEDASVGNLALLRESLCVDAGDPNSVPDPDGTRADMGAYSLDRCSPIPYCVAKQTSQGCVPSIGTVGNPSLSSGLEFRVTATDVLNSRAGQLIYSLGGRNDAPFNGGSLCVQPPMRRTPLQLSGGDAPTVLNCTGTYDFDFNAWVQQGVDLGLTMGTVVNAQYFFRDPQDSNGIGLTNAVEFSVCP